ncbi:MAG: hypothetical protein RBT65_19270 [Methanolobus sp.]|nr:hypothetical protein [Methanolobus sp.]
MTVATKKAVSKKNASKKEKAVEAKAVEVKKEEVREAKKISNTQKCANMILALARDAKHTRNEIVQTVSDALKALSVVTVKTMMSDLQNAKYAKRYSSHTIAVNKETKIVTVASEIKA